MYFCAFVSVSFWFISGISYRYTLVTATILLPRFSYRYNLVTVLSYSPLRYCYD